MAAQHQYWRQKFKFNTENQLIEMCYSEIYFEHPIEVFLHFILSSFQVLFFYWNTWYVSWCVIQTWHGMAWHIYSLCLTRTHAVINSRILMTVLFYFVDLIILLCIISITIIYFFSISRCSQSYVVRSTQINTHPFL